MENKPLYKERCFARIGKSFMKSLYATWPLSKFEFYDDHIVLSVLIKKVSLKFSEIDNIEKYSHVIAVGLGNGIKVNHHADIPPFLVFWPKKKDNIISLFQQKGIMVKK